MTTYKTLENDYVYKCCEMQISYSTKVKAAERITAITSDTLADAFRKFYSDGTIEYCEIMYAALLDNQFRIIGIIRCSEGVLDSTPFNFKKIMQAALLCNAKAIAICHNHPSGSLIPSTLDKECTRKLMEMCRVMQYKLVDHIILTSESYYSFNDKGYL